MIPVYQTRTALERLGNCFEACIASILEVPLTAVPDRADHLPAGFDELVERELREKGDAGDVELDLGPWDAALEAWLEPRGLAIFDLQMTEPLELPGFTIETWRTLGGYAHAVVSRAGQVVHNPHRGLLGAEGLTELLSVAVFVALDPPKVSRLETLPDLEGELARASA